MDLNQQKEQFSQAYVQAVAAVAGYAWSKPSVDDDSIDFAIHQRGGGGTIRSPRLDVQLKCHAAEIPSEDTLRFQLKLKNYDDLRATGLQVPRILIVVLVPDTLGDWLKCDVQQMILRRCGLWFSLRGLPEIVSTAEKPENQKTTLRGGAARWRVDQSLQLMVLAASPTEDGHGRGDDPV